MLATATSVPLLWGITVLAVANAAFLLRRSIKLYIKGQAWQSRQAFMMSVFSLAMSIIFGCAAWGITWGALNAFIGGAIYTTAIVVAAFFAYPYLAKWLDARTKSRT